MASYRIQGQTLTSLADQVRTMAGTGQTMTPAEMVSWLQKVIYTPIGWGSCCALLQGPPLLSAATGALLAIPKGLAQSALRAPALNLTSILY